MLESIIERIKEGHPFHERNVVHNLFSWKELENLLNLRPLMTNGRLHVSDCPEFNWNQQFWNEIETIPPSVVENMVNGRHANITHASKVKYEINQIAAELERATNLPADAHIYFDLEYGKGFGPHYDYSHNLIVQVEGKTKVKVWKTISNENEMRQLSEEPDDDILLEEVLLPGDVVFIPSYFYHSAYSLSKRLSISFPLWNKVKEEPTTEFPDRHWLKLNLD